MSDREDALVSSMHELWPEHMSLDPGGTRHVRVVGLRFRVVRGWGVCCQHSLSRKDVGFRICTALQFKNSWLCDYLGDRIEDHGYALGP